MFKNLLLLCIAFTLTAAIPRQSKKLTVAFVSIDGADFKEIRQVEKNIESYYNSKAYRLPALETPDGVMKNGRDTVLASSLLQHLKKVFSKSEFDKIVAVTEKPLYFSEHYTSIRGLGTMEGKTAVVSTYKIKHEAGGDRKFYKSLLLKVSRHEIGHTLGLGHCSTESKCVMTSGVIPTEFYALKSTLCES